MSRKPMFNDNQVQKMKDAYVMGGSPLVKIAVDFGVSVPTISKYLRNAGVEIRSRGRRKGSKNVPKVDACVEMPVAEPVEDPTDPIYNLEPEVPATEVERTPPLGPPPPWKFNN